MIHPIIKEARTYIGTPWRHLQRSRSGCDCVGFLMAVGAKFGLDGTEVENYCRYPIGNSLVDAMRGYLQEIPIADRQIGDFLVFRIYKIPTHVGILSYDNRFIHAVPEQSIAEVPLDPMWQRRLVAVFRISSVRDSDHCAN